MKYILFLFLFFSKLATAQDTIQVVQSDVVFHFGRDTSYDAGEPITVSIKTARFKQFFLNQDGRYITLVWAITDSTFKFKSGDFQSTQPPYDGVQKAVNEIFIKPDGSTAAWSVDEMISKYVLKDSAGNPLSTETGAYLLNSDGLGIMDGWSFYQLKATQPIPITMLFKAAGLRAAAEGRLNRPVN